MFQAITVCALLAFSAIAEAKDNSCSVHGDLIHWQADYCLYKGETDDFLQAGVQKCFKEERKKQFNDSCMAKIEYKKLMCNMMAEYPPYNGSTKKCLKDPAFSGPAVRAGGI